MKRLSIFLACAPLIMALARWFMDGSRFAFWVTSVETFKEIPIVEGMPELGTQTQIIWEERFVSGIETPLLGLLLSILLLGIFHLLKTHGFTKKP
ncbi:MAG: hypothetical protein CMI27_00570 [Opitutae bacterium]|nr:hypothetical protein [Opitutae bacterium]|tara:strand:+ start:8727 stop:9011 length:285 start_codon:yes stop_codon:yes gene_type:complete